jgi:hypothetical protein
MCVTVCPDFRASRALTRLRQVIIIIEVRLSIKMECVYSVVIKLNTCVETDTYIHNRVIHFSVCSFHRPHEAMTPV